jgi:hypothetical protein
VRRVDRDAALLFLGRVVDRRKVADGRVRALFRQDLRDRRGEGRLAVVDVTDRADVDVRLGALELLLAHSFLSVYALCESTSSVAID